MIDNKMHANHRGGDRQSNIEVLRLLSMLMVLNLHSFWGFEHGNGILQVIDFFRECTSICAVNVFLMISGYFGIRWKFKSFFNLVFQLFFYSFGVYGVAVLLGFASFSFHDIVTCIKCLYDSWGFITGYVLLYFCAPLLNAFAEKVSSRKLLSFIIIFFVAEIFICRSQVYLNYGVIYLIGRFLNKTNAIERLRLNATKVYWITTVLIFICVYLLYKFVLIDSAKVMNDLVLGLSYSSPLVILQAVSLFLVFARMNFHNKFVNWCSASCLSIFLIHMHPSIKYIGYYSFPESLYSKPLLYHMGTLIILIAIVFWGSILIDRIRIYISNVIYSVLCLLKNQIPQKFFVMDTYIPFVIRQIL